MAEWTRRKIGCPVAQHLSIPLLAMLLGSPTAGADAIAANIQYSTTGWISQPYGPPATATVPIGFLGVTGGTLDDFRAIDLGDFVLTPSPGVSTTFTDTPFGIEFLAPQFDRMESDAVTPPPPGQPYWTFKQSYGKMTILGRLDGTVGDNGTSDVVATIDEVILGPGPYMPLPAAGIHVSGLPFENSDIYIPRQFDLSTGPGGHRLVGVTAEVVPEPSSALLFLLAGSTWSAWKLRHLNPERRDLAR